MTRPKLLVTGSAGFIFGRFIEQAIKEEWSFDLASIDKIAAPRSIANVFQHPRHKFYLGDCADPHFVNRVFETEKPDLIVHGAAESFVDHSIDSALPFVHSNIVGTQVMLDAAVKFGVSRFLYVSTDEVYGQLISRANSPWNEESPTQPRNPYAATKLAGECLVYAASQTHQLPIVITRCCNNYGAGQSARNLIPQIVNAAKTNTPVSLHGKANNIREWIYVSDHCSAIRTILESKKPDTYYNIGTGEERTNLEMVQEIGSLIQRPIPIQFIANRKGHDYRYAVNCERLTGLGWLPRMTLRDGLQELTNPKGD